MSAIGKFGRSPRARAAGAVLVAGGMLSTPAWPAPPQAVRRPLTRRSARWATPPRVSGTKASPTRWRSDRRIDHVGLPGRRAQRRVDSWESGATAPRTIRAGSLRLPPGSSRSRPRARRTPTPSTSRDLHFICEFHPGMAGSVVVAGGTRRSRGPGRRPPTPADARPGAHDGDRRAVAPSPRRRPHDDAPPGRRGRHGPARRRAARAQGARVPRGSRSSSRRPRR